MNQNRDNSLRCVVFYLAQYPFIHMGFCPEALKENNQGQMELVQREWDKMMESMQEE